jgi:hypothetical protein
MRISAIMFYVLRAFLPSLPGGCRHADLGIKAQLDRSGRSATKKGSSLSFSSGGPAGPVRWRRKNHLSVPVYALRATYLHRRCVSRHYGA